MAASDKHPEEFYGRLVTPATASQLPLVLHAQHCPFLNTRCKKMRKSDPGQTIGACTVGYQGAPLIICPHRFIEHNLIFRDARDLLVSGDEFRIVPEVTMPGGSIDYFLVSQSRGEIRDYLGLEVQALDTTGSGGIWDARQDLAQGRLRDTYSYGINWKMSAKTILVQLFHKAAAFDELKKKFVLTIQTEFFNYLEGQFQLDQLRTASRDDVFHLHIYDCVRRPQQLDLRLRERLSTNLSGVERMLSQGGAEQVLEADVINRIRAKLPRSRSLDDDRPLEAEVVTEGD